MKSGGATWGNQIWIKVCLRLLTSVLFYSRALLQFHYLMISRAKVPFYFLFLNRLKYRVLACCLRAFLVMLSVPLHLCKKEMVEALFLLYHTYLYPSSIFRRKKIYWLIWLILQWKCWAAWTNPYRKQKSSVDIMWFHDILLHFWYYTLPGSRWWEFPFNYIYCISWVIVFLPCLF